MVYLMLVLRGLTMRLRSVPGAVIMLEYIRKYFIKSGRQIVVNDFDKDLYFITHLGGHMSSQIFWYGSYSRHVLRVLDCILKPGMTVLDVGANAGEITVFAAKRVGAEGKVISFEPLSDIAEELKLNVALNRMAQVEIVQMGLSDSSGDLPMYSAEGEFHDGSYHEGLGTLYPGGKRLQKLETVKLTTVDKLSKEGRFDHVDVIKVDVEGAELPVLRGARTVIESHRPWLILEVSSKNSGQVEYESSDILKYLSEFGYSFYTINRHTPLRALTIDQLASFQNVLACPSGKSLPVV